MLICICIAPTIVFFFGWVFFVLKASSSVMETGNDSGVSLAFCSVFSVLDIAATCSGILIVVEPAKPRAYAVMILLATPFAHGKELPQLTSYTCQLISPNVLTQSRKFSFPASSRTILSSTPSREKSSHSTGRVAELLLLANSQAYNWLNKRPIESMPSTWPQCLAE